MQQNLKQWISQLSREALQDFICIFVNQMNTRIYQEILQKKFTRNGGIYLEKVIMSLLHFFQQIVNNYPIRSEFSTLLSIASVLSADTYSEITDYIESNNETSLNSNLIRDIIKLRTDFKI